MVVRLPPRKVKHSRCLRLPGQAATPHVSGPLGRSSGRRAVATPCAPSPDARVASDQAGDRQWVAMIRVLIGCDVRIYREGLVDALGRVEGLHIQDAVDRVDDLVTRADEVQPNVVLLDVSMPGSLSAIRSIREAAPGVWVVAVGVAETEPNLLSWFETGTDGYVSKDASLHDLLRTIETVARGEVVCSPRIAASLFRELAGRHLVMNGDAVIRLTSRERQILELIDQRLSNKEIARALQISLSTVKNHVHNILAKRQVHRRADAAATVPHSSLTAPTPEMMPPPLPLGGAMPSGI
jgi:two-component system, NarL family, nitrate/nitrite response regulator NarL